MRISLILLFCLGGLAACDGTGPTQDAPEPNPEDVPSVLDTPECPVRAVADLADAETAFAELASCHGLAAEAVTCAANDRWLVVPDFLDPDLGFTGRLVVGRPFVACSYTVDGVAARPVYFHLPPVQRAAVAGTFGVEGQPGGACGQLVVDRYHTDRRNRIYVNSMAEWVEGWTEALVCEGLQPEQFEVDCWGLSYTADPPSAHVMCRITRFDIGSVWPASSVIGTIY